MSKHFRRVIVAAVGVAVAAVPAVIADPSFAHYVAQHPWAATYLPLVSGVVLATYRAAKDKTETTTPGTSTSVTGAGTK